ncbi:peptidase inhibitor family I36 protein [Streptomyces microflavus]|uniref:peptidase inhibitor family I36 protein n=1 Tax=Streptomyces microflavus TaxID=1919 RepID=UPI002E156C0F|nr:peptidase inhibitor family I36 protein [Streptomyces microflavus]WSR95817.1 peptidase inhibitor family I36 protein [Streptomyces microflavus]
MTENAPSWMRGGGVPGAYTTGKICFWQGENFSGTKLQREYADSCDPIGTDAQSVLNRSSKAIGLYRGWACVGASWRGDVSAGGWKSFSESVSRISRI